MKKTALCLARISAILLLTAPLLHAAEQQTIFNTESIQHESGTGAEMCQEKCRRKSGPDVKSLLSMGWKIVSSSPKEVVGEVYRYIPCNTCEPHGCICIGTEYVVQRDDQAPRAETPDKGAEPRENEKRTVIQAPKAETPVNAPEALDNKAKTVQPAPRAEPPVNAPEALDKNRQSGLQAPKAETPGNDVDLLKKEIELLKQENENLRKQLKSKP
jgi:hypothetical protein